MNYHTHCPVCNNEISQDRHLTSGSSICACGWTDSNVNEKASLELENKKVKIMVGFAICASLMYGHMLSWGSYAFVIPFVKIQQLTGTLSKQGYEDLAHECIALNKWSCAKTAYLDLFHQTGDPEGIQELAHLEVLLGEKPQALQTYASYFKMGGKTGDAAIQYGLLLEENSQYNEALHEYDESVRLNPMALPINATAASVRLLIKVGRYQEAYQRINDFHDSAENAKGYLNTELAQLEAKLGPAGQAMATKNNPKASSRKRNGVASL